MTPPTPTNPLRSLAQLGQSVWLDFIKRSLMSSGELAKQLEQDDLRGMTSNPAIFEKAIGGSAEYDEQMKSVLAAGDLDAKALFERLAITDIQQACDILRPVFERTGRRDGYVSLEVSPYLARDEEGTVAEARRLRETVARDNVMIKIPGTEEGIPAFERMTAHGANINVTLLFSSDVWERVALAYIAGLEKLAAGGGDVAKVESVASFFVSRIDSVVDGMVAGRLKAAPSPADKAALEGLRGAVAIANARLVYQRWKKLFSGARWDALAAKGARAQRLLWASTGTKDPKYRDVLYIEELVGPDTVNTIPPATYDAFKDHGKARASLEEGLDAAKATIDGLAKLDISLDAICKKLVDDGVTLFADAFDKLLGAVEKKRAALLGSGIDAMRATLPGEVAVDVKASLEDWRKHGKVRRLWAKDASLWTKTDEGQWLGWLDALDAARAALPQYEAIAKDAREARFAHALVIGMGGSSLCPDVLAKTFGKFDYAPQLHVIDSTDPAQIAATEARLDLAKTLFVVASKSGSTLEPNILKAHFWERAKAAVGAAEVGRRFIAITDPGSQMEAQARAEGFRHIVLGTPSIGGRFSALSPFGLVPAALMGLDVGRLVRSAEAMARSCGAFVPPDVNPGVLLGTFLGVAAAKYGLDKLTIATSPGLRALGGWLEQLVAESTGKDGKAIIPVDLETLSAQRVYGLDRVFVYVRLEGDPDEATEGTLEALARGGHPVIRIAVADRYALGQELFRFEVATAVAGSILKINPFNQPDVEAAKIATKALTTEYEKTGALPAETLLAESEWGAALKALLAKLQPKDYFAVLAFVDMNPAHEEALQAIRHLVRDRKKVATCLGFGPRFLHSTGQAYKGGPGTGVFLQITCDDAADLPVPGAKYTFGVVKAAQARGDLQVLVERGRRTLRIHLGKDVAGDLAKLKAAVEAAL